MARKQARRGSTSGGLTGFLAGLICGLGLAALAWVGGYMPRGDQEPATATTPTGRDEPPIIEGQPDDAGRNRQYEFFTVLPEIEVVVPTREIEQRARETEQRQQSDQASPQQPDSTQNPPVSGSQRYVIQAGSFRSGSDAEALKARLAMLGQVASVQTVTVNGTTWHRVRLGPFDASQANRTRQQLQDSGFESMVLSAN